MMIRILPLMIVLLSIVFPSMAETESRMYTRISLDGEWDFRTIRGVYTASEATSNAPKKWRKINVPANWFMENVDHAGSAIYRRKITLDEISEKKKYFIRFSGVDYALDLWVNNHFVGSHEGYFQAFEFNFSDYLNAGANTIHAVVHSPNEPVGRVWSLHKRLIKGIFNHHDTRPGGAWSERGQDQNTGGIWNGVTLYIKGETHFEAIKMHADFDPEEFADNKHGKISISYKLNRQKQKANTEIQLRLTPINFEGASYVKKIDQDFTRRGYHQFEIKHDNVQLWWPFEIGQPNLYEAELTLYVNGIISDTYRETFGYRSITRTASNGQWFVNGKRFFLRGTNYIPTQWLSEMSDEDYDTDLGLMRSANINAVRVHAHVGSQKFYDAADRMGILVWQDFPLQWGYDDSEEFKLNANRQAREMLNQFDHHPSIFVWSLHNEPPWDADWMKYKYPDYDKNQNRELTHSLYETVKNSDPTRYTHMHSSTAEHPWLGWYSGKWTDYANPTTENLISEFGAQALPDLQSLRRIFPEQTVWPDQEDEWKLWQYHNFQKHELTNIAGVKIGSSIEEFIENTQTYQATLTKYAAESLRRQKYNPVGGIFQFMFNENWPSVNWGILDYWRNPKPGYRSLKIAYQPILISFEWRERAFKIGESVDTTLWVVNDLYENHPGAKINLSLRMSDGVTPVGEYMVNVKEDSVLRVAIWQRVFTQAGSYTLAARLTSRDGKTLSLNEYQFQIVE